MTRRRSLERATDVREGVTATVSEFGPKGGVPVVLVHGLGMTKIDWPRAFVDAIAGAGFRVIMFDNRDVGRAPRLDAMGNPPLVRLWLASRGAPLPTRPPYSIADMADDLIFVLDRLGIESAHVVGASMGGMIAQRAVLAQPHRFRSITCIMSSSGARGLPQMHDDVARLMRAGPGKAKATPESAAQTMLALRTVLATSLGATDRAELDSRIRNGIAYGGTNDDGVSRQFAAVLGDRDRAEALSDIDLPALVIHGTDDPLLPLAHGRDLAKRLRGARFECLPGWGHEIRASDALPIATLVIDHIAAVEATAAETPPAPHVDVVIVGAGLSGIAAAHHLRTQCPGKSYAIVEGRDAVGGTWDLFRYPGIRSDSDMFTLGYSFRPWLDAKTIATGAEIRDYITQTAIDEGISEKIRFGHKVVAADWSSRDKRWTLQIETAAGRRTITCGFLYACSGYYRYDRGHFPEFERLSDFAGTVVHPQFWPADLDWRHRHVVVIGSGATAVTLIPSLAETAGHVTMLQRSPTYIASVPATDGTAVRLRKLLPEMLAYRINRVRHIATSLWIYALARRRPALVRQYILDAIKRELGNSAEVDRNFSPRYDPWDQRLCVVPDGDLFKALRRGRASIVTDTIAHFEKDGIRLASGNLLKADLVVCATGLELVFLGGIAVSVDGRDVDMSKRYTYRGTMFSGVPNLAVAIGYTNASWTLKCELTAQYVCRLLNHMDRHGHSVCTPERDGMPEDSEAMLGLTAGYVQRAYDLFPKQGSDEPWRMSNNYLKDIFTFRWTRIASRGLRFR